jgi:hypothetical protein
MIIFSSSKEPCELLAADGSDVTEIQTELA